MANGKHRAEEWRDVAGFENLYLISSHGRIQTLHSGKSRRGSMRSLVLTKAGYFRVILFNKDHRKRILVHRLVCEAFIPNPLGLPFVNHKNGVRNDNRIENLEWCTAKQNSEHAANVLHSYEVGVNKHGAKLDEADVRSIRGSYKGGENCASIGRRFGVSKQTVKSIVDRLKWKHVL